jgi:hypothetical protein
LWRPNHIVLAQSSIEGAAARVGAMLLGTKDVPAGGDGSEGGWHRLRGFLDDVRGRGAYLTLKQVGGAKEIEGSDVRHCSHLEAIIVVPIQKFDDLLAAQSLKIAQ